MLAKLFDKGVGRGDKALLLLADLEGRGSVRSIREHGIAVGFRDAAKWNLSDVLKNQQPRCLLMAGAWSLTEQGWKHLREAGLLTSSPIVTKTGGMLERQAAALTDRNRRAFVEEAVACFNGGQWRACIVLSWVGAMRVIQEHVVNRHLSAFNQASTARYKAHYKPAISVEHLSRYQEADVLQLCEDIGVIDKSMKKHLVECLDRRNTSGHPNNVSFNDHTVAHHVEFLVNNVYGRY